MTETEIKTRLGLILQGVLGAAIKRGGYSSVENYQYDPTCEKPDFLIPDEKKPAFMIEVHQTEARNSFQMKTLRAFTAVTEAKAFYGDKLVSVNVLFGDPDRELPASNVRALEAVFDISLVPRKASGKNILIAKLEATALAKAADEAYTNRTPVAIQEVIAGNPDAVLALATLLTKVLATAKARPQLFPLWKAERVRTTGLSAVPKSGNWTYYKRGLLASLFLSNDDFAELLAKKDPNKCSPALQRQVCVAGIAKLEELVEGDHITLDPHFAEFITDRRTPTLSSLCRDALAATPDLKWFFEDIRDAERRLKMARVFLLEARGGKARFSRAFSKTELGVPHARCWFADMAPLAIGKSHNYFNRAIYGHPEYNVSLGNPYNNMVIRAPRLGNDPAVLELLERLACEIFFKVVATERIDLSTITEKGLADALLEFRIGAAIKLRKLDPFGLVVSDIVSRYGLILEVEAIPNAIADLADLGGAGRFRIPVVTNPLSGKRVLLNAIAVHEGNGDHKSKEWGARRLATLYRFEGARFWHSEFADGLFVLDGEWEDKDVARLYRSGWNHVCRLSGLENTLESVFGLKQPTPPKKRKPPPLVFEEGDAEA